MRCGLLIEAKGAREEVFGSVWEAVEEVNKGLPEHARIQREMLVFAEAGRPFVRAAKGTIVRAATTALYEKEIEVVYGC